MPARPGILLCLLLGSFAQASEVDLVLTDGETVHGTLVRSDDEHVYVRLPDESHTGSILAVMTYERARIERMTVVSEAMPEYGRRLAAVADTAADHADLARWCFDQDLLPQARSEALRAETIRKDTDTELLLLRLGMTYAEGTWQPEDQYLARTGRVKYAGTIMPQEEADALRQEAEDNGRQRR